MLIDRGPWSPWIAAAGDDPRPYAWSKPWRRLPWWLVVCVVTGRETVFLPGAEIPIATGCTYAIPPGLRHRIRSDGDQPVWIHAELAWHPRRGEAGVQPDARSAFGIELPLLATGRIASRLRREIPRLVAQWRSGGPLQRAAASLDLGSSLVAWAMAAAGPGDDVGDRLARAEEAVRRDPGGCGVEQMAAAAGWRRSRFCSIYLQQRGHPPGRFIRHTRLALVKELLADTSLPLHAIAARSGYADAPALARAVLRHHRCSPGVWRAHLRDAGAS